MRKILLSLLVLVASTTIASANTFEKGTAHLSVGVGSGIYQLPLEISYEHGILNFNNSMSLGVGATAILGLNNFNSRNQFFGANVNYHFTGVNNLDLYAGPVVGFERASSSFDAGFNIGVNYFFVKDWALNLEFGSAVKNFMFGFTYKM